MPGQQKTGRYFIFASRLCCFLLGKPLIARVFVICVYDVLTKGKHTFFVVSHADRPHPHVHIYYNSTTLDCTRKFRDFLGSGWAFRRLSDRVCIEHGLSYIAYPKLKSKGKFKHYGEWQSDKPQTFQERLKAQIDICLAQKPSSLDDFIQLMAAAGYQHKYGRGGGLSFRTEGQKNYTRLRAATLGKGYGPENIQAASEAGFARVVMCNKSGFLSSFMWR